MDSTPYGNHNILGKTSKYKIVFSLMPSNLTTILCIDYHEIVSIAIFKKKIYARIRHVTQTTYDIHQPEGLKFIFQLRVGLSDLRYHKRRHNFIDTPSDAKSFSFHLSKSPFPKNRSL